MTSASTWGGGVATVTLCSSPSCSTCTNGPLATANCRTAPRTGFCKPAIPGNCFFSNCSSTHTWSSVSKLNSSKTKSTRCCFDEHTTLAFLMCGRLVGTGSSEAVIAGQAVVERSAAAGRVVVVTIAAAGRVVVVTIAAAGRVVVETSAAAGQAVLINY